MVVNEVDPQPRQHRQSRGQELHGELLVGFETEEIIQQANQENQADRGCQLPH